MTEGTSQGLFIVVAIVIFGIFAVLAYILFEDTLSPAMASMFTQATEQASDRLSSNENLINTTDLGTYEPYYNNIRFENNTIFMTAVHPGFVTVRSPLTVSNLELGKKYKMTGYMYLDGEPIPYENWLVHKSSSYRNTGDVKVDNKTGYFEDTFTYEVDGSGPYIIHAKVRNMNDTNFPAGSIVSIKDLKLIKID